MTKRIFIIHGWGARPEEGWRPWLKNELEKRGFSVSIPSMPNTDNPKMNEWVSTLSDAIGAPDENCCLVGHSLGCTTILRYLEKLQENETIGGSILVAGVYGKPKFKELQNFFEKPVEWGKIKSHCKKFVAVHSDDDPYIPLAWADIAKSKLDSEVIMQSGKGHFTEELTELPVVLEEILKMAK